MKWVTVGAVATVSLLLLAIPASASFDPDFTLARTGAKTSTRRGQSSVSRRYSRTRSPTAVVRVASGPYAASFLEGSGASTTSASMAASVGLATSALKAS